jgi:hypothetical protein
MSKSPLSQLASISEGMIGKATSNPTAARLLQTGQQLLDRTDDLTKRVRGLEAMEKRIVELEERVEKLEHKRSRKPAASKGEPDSSASGDA